MMNYASMDYIINTIYKTNILPITSDCNTACIFCSHRQNPDGVLVYRMPKLSVQDFRELIDYLSKDRKIVIGESASRIIEGEPLVYKDLPQVLRMLRSIYPTTPIQITTNGILLNDSFVKLFEDLGKIELNISLNSISHDKRITILGCNNKDIRENIQALRGKVDFTGSFVYTPEVHDKCEVEEMVKFLDENGASCIRAFLPGTTYLSAKTYPLDETYKELNRMISGFGRRYETPIIIEPQHINNLIPVIEGIVPESASKIGGLCTGDIVECVNNEPVVSRVDLYNKVFRAKNPKLTVKRNDDQIDISLMKKKQHSAGFVVLYDIDPSLKIEVLNLIKRYKAENILFITSVLAEDLIKEFFGKCVFEFKYKVISARNSFFSGNISCAGLLTVEDIILAIGEFLECNQVPDLIVLPPVMFDYTKKDLIGKSIADIHSRFDIPVDIP